MALVEAMGEGRRQLSRRETTLFKSESESEERGGGGSEVLCFISCLFCYNFLSDEPYLFRFKMFFRMSNECVNIF